MNGVYKYILHVICTVMLCGVVSILFSEEKSSVIKLVTGFIITAVVISPLLHKKTINLDALVAEYTDDSNFAVAEGEQAAREASEEFIKSKMETYILNKAEAMGSRIHVNVILSETKIPTPAEIKVSGTISPYVKEQLSVCIQNDLGIAKDNQIWIS